MPRIELEASRFELGQQLLTRLSVLWDFAAALFGGQGFRLKAHL
jgi:hypothetical protein